MGHLSSEADTDDVNWLERVRIVLVGTSHAGNIGMVARAMKTMGLSRLVLVSPRAEIDDQARSNAKHAVDVLDAAEIYPELGQAIGGSVGVWATSARPRGLNLPLRDVRGSVDEMRQRLSRQADAEVSVVFGAERTGLTNAELLQAESLIAIPANPDYPVLNLSQAVQVVAYELQLATQASDSVAAAIEPAEPLARMEAIAALVDRLGLLLDERCYFGEDDPNARDRLLGRVRLLLNRGHPSDNELAILHGMLTALTGHRS